MAKIAVIRAEVKRYEVFPVGKTPVRITLSVETTEGSCALHLDEVTALGVAADILNAMRVAKGEAK